MEGWRLGCLEEPQRLAWAVASGDDVAERCAAKHAAKGVQVRSTKPSTATADLADLLQIKGVLAHVGRTMEAWKFRSLEAWRSPRG